MARKLVGTYQGNVEDLNKEEPKMQGMVGSMAGGLVAPYPLSIATTAAGAYGGKMLEQGTSPIPPSSATMLLDSFINPKRYQENIQKYYSFTPEQMKQEKEALKYAAGQAGIEAGGGLAGKLVGKLGKLVEGPLQKIGIGLPRKVGQQATDIVSQSSDDINQILTEASNKGGKIDTKPIIDKLDMLLKKYGPQGAKDTEAVKAINKIKDRFLEYKGKGFSTVQEFQNLLQGNEIRQSMSSKVWTPKGQESMRTGASMVETKARKLTGGEIRKQLTEQVQQTIGKGSELDKLFKDSGVYTQIAKDMKSPLKPKNSIGTLALIGGMLSSAGGFNSPLSAIMAPVLGAYGVSQTPYLKYLAQKGIGKGLQATEKLIPATGKLLSKSTESSW